MTNNLLFDFTVDKATKTVFITREFDAELSLVWDAFTTADLLDQSGASVPKVHSCLLIPSRLHRR